MKHPIQILVTGSQAQDLETLLAALAELPAAELRRRLLEDRQMDPLLGAVPAPDILVHCLGPRAREELQALAAGPARPGRALVVVDTRGEMDPAAIRLAMQAGARDFLVGPSLAEDLRAAVRRILKDKLAETAGTERPLTAVINAKGGAGGSTVAGNLAHLLAAREGLRTALLDLDLQFGAQTQQFDLHPQQGLLDALAAAEGLDEVALAAYMAKHPGGLHILGRLGDQILLPAEVADRAVEQVLELAQQAYRHVVVDLPRLVDPVLNRAVERASTVLIVLQQSFAHLRDGKRLARLLTEELELRPERIEIVVNRYEPKAAIRIDEIERALGREVRHLIPNDYRPFHAAGNLGMPVSEYAPQSPGTRALGRLAAALGPGGGREDRDGLLRRFLGRFGREG